MKTEAEMQTEGRVWARRIDNYTPLINTNPEAQPQTTLQEANQ